MSISAATVSWKSVIKNLYVIVLLAVIVFVFTMISPRFIGERNVINIVRQSVVLTLVGGAFTLIMISGNIDLSVGGVVGLSSVIYALLARQGMPLYMAGVVTVGLGVFVGAINGFLIMKLRIVHLIATLATMTLCMGLGRLLSPEGIGLIRDLPEGIETFARSRFLFGLPPAVYVAVLVIAAMVVMQKKTTLGKYTAAIGGNRTAAELSGINVVQTVWILYVICGACAALAGVVRTSSLSLGDPTTGAGMELSAIIVVLLGGTRFTGGEGSVWRTVVAVMILTCLAVGVQVVGMPPYWSSLVTGVMLVVALVIATVLKEKIID